MSTQPHNQLSNTGSPYLLQHAKQPVHWYPWSDEPFKKAAAENKLVIISIGYAACHWCHVMAHESFDDAQVAKIMNEHFVAVKIDREEHPEVDAFYINAVQKLTGQAGWPLNCFALADGTPVYGGTYFTKDRWISLLENLARTQASDPKKVRDLATDLRKSMEQGMVTNSVHSDSLPPFSELLENMEQHFDLEYGGTKGAPKFPIPSMYWPIIDAYKQMDNKYRSFLKDSLNLMAMGGIHDQVAGGFSRYTIDEKWFVPHFEKMLYDNAQLVSLYASASEVTRIPYYAQVAERIVGFMEECLRHDSGLYYASLDADSPDGEGAYYTWTEQELEPILGDLLAAFKHRYGIKKEGNWEKGKNILYVAKSTPEVGIALKTAKEIVHAQLQHARELLHKHRKMRTPPAKDTKLITSWNALAITGLLDLYSATKKTPYFERAREMADTLMDEYLRQDTLLRIQLAGSTITATIEDYAYLAYALLRMYLASFHVPYAEMAKRITDEAIRKCWDEETRMFALFKPEHPVELLPEYPVRDDVMPSANAVMSLVLKLMGRLFEAPDYTLKYKQLLASATTHISRMTIYSGFWVKHLATQELPDEIVIIGPSAKEFYQQLKWHIPFTATVLLAYEKTTIPWALSRWDDNATRVYICRDGQCTRPQTSVKEATAELTH